MMAMTAFAVDIMLPGLAQIGAELGLAEANDRQFIITFYLVGFAVGQLFFGPLSDRFGRLYVVGAGGAPRCSPRAWQAGETAARGGAATVRLEQDHFD